MADGPVHRMVQVRCHCSNRNPRDGLAGGITQLKMVRTVGLEPTRRCRLRILSPVCLPVPPRPLLHLPIR